MNAERAALLPLDAAEFTQIIDALCFYIAWHELESERVSHPLQLRAMYCARVDAAKRLLNELQSKFARGAP